MKMSSAAWAVMVCSMLLPSCSPNASRVQSLIEQVEDLQSDQRDLAKEVSDHRRLVQTAAAERERLAVERSQIEMLIRKFKEDISALKVEFVGYKIDYRRAIQARAKGMALPDLSVGAKFYEKVVVSSATDSDLTVLHKQGMARVPLAQAPPAIQELFGYDESLASGKPPPGVDHMALAILQGKKSAEENRRLIAEMKTAEERKNSAPGYIAAPATSTGYSWKTNSSFEGSYWAPLKNRETGSVGKVNSTSRYNSLFDYNSGY